VPARRGPQRADPRDGRTPGIQQRAGAQALHPTRSPSVPAPRQPPAPSRPGRGRATTKRATTDRAITQRVAQPAAAPTPTGIRRAAVSAGPRMRFAILVLVLLGGGLICLLVINTTLGAKSFRISQLQSANASLTSQEQALQQQIAAERSPAQIARRAYQLGMRTEPNANILDLRTHRIDKLPAQPDAVVPLGGPALPSGSRP
jgi:uncharacterized protein HemX